VPLRHRFEGLVMRGNPVETWTGALTAAISPAG